MLQCEVISNKNSGFNRRRRKEVHVLKVNSSLAEAKLFKLRECTVYVEKVNAEELKKCIKNSKIKKKFKVPGRLLGFKGGETI